MAKAVNELGLEWSPPEDPSRSMLNEWFLPGRRQALCQRLSPFFPEVHDELTKSWRAPYSSHIRPFASATLTSVDGSEEKGYKDLLPLDESVAAHLCPLTAIRWKARANHLSKPCRATSAHAGHSYSADGQAASALHWMAVFQVFQAKMFANEEAGLDSASLRDLRSETDLCSTHHQSHHQSHRAFDVQPDSVGAPPLAHDDRDERGIQSPLPRHSGFVRQPVWTSCGGLC